MDVGTSNNAVVVPDLLKVMEAAAVLRVGRTHLASKGPDGAVEASRPQHLDLLASDRRVRLGLNRWL